MDFAQFKVVFAASSPSGCRWCVPREVLYDRMKTVVLGGDDEGEIRYHPTLLAT